MKHLIGIDLFAGAGGLSLGAEHAGVDVLCAIENDPWAATSYEHNHKKGKIICGDIREQDPSRLKTELGDVFIIMGGPPCQGFSLSNTMNRSMENEKNQLFREFVRFVKVIRPEWFVLENVPGMKLMNGGETYKHIAGCFEELGYVVKTDVLWANQFGVPQNRERFFMVGNRVEINFEFPQPHTLMPITVKEAISDLPMLRNGDQDETIVREYTQPLSEVSDYARKMREGCSHPTQNLVSRNNELVIERYKHIGQGQNWRAVPDHLMQNYANKQRCHSGIYKRLREDKPSVVIANYRKSMLIHPTQDRGLSVREAARLQSFPDSFEFKGPLMYIQQQIGNAVPPLLAEAVFRQILTYYN